MASSSKAGTLAFDAPELDQVKRTLVAACHILDREGITGGYGHVSVRVPGTTAFLTIANVSPGCASVNRLIMLDCEGAYLGGAETPPNEWPIHACVLRARPNVMSVCHTHSVWSTLFSVLPIKLRPLHHYGKFLSADGLPLYERAGLVRTVERGDVLAAALGNGPAVLMRAHGDTVVGASIEQAVQRTVRLAKLGEIAHLALLHGEPRYLTAEELETFSADERFPEGAVQGQACISEWRFLLDALFIYTSLTLSHTAKLQIHHPKIDPHGSAGATQGCIEDLFEGPKQLRIGQKLVRFGEFLVQLIERRVDKTVSKTKLLGSLSAHRMSSSSFVHQRA